MCFLIAYGCGFEYVVCRTNTEDFNPVDADLNSSSSSSSSSSGTLRSMDNHDGGESVRRVSTIYSESHSVEATVVLSAAVVADIQFVSVGRIEVSVAFGTEVNIRWGLGFFCFASDRNCF
jgi:hypothetical protein